MTVTLYVGLGLGLVLGYGGITHDKKTSNNTRAI
jgi:hypothetical protein